MLTLLSLSSGMAPLRGGERTHTGTHGSVKASRLRGFLVQQRGLENRCGRFRPPWVRIPPPPLLAGKACRLQGVYPPLEKTQAPRSIAGRSAAGGWPSWPPSACTRPPYLRLVLDRGGREHQDDQRLHGPRVGELHTGPLRASHAGKRG